MPNKQEDESRFSQKAKDYAFILFKGKLLGETAKAYKFQIDGAGPPHWLPKSQCTWEPKTNRLWIVGWLVEERGLKTEEE